MKKFLFISLISVLLLSFLCIGVSAESLVREDSLNDGVSLRSVPDTPSGYPYPFTFKEVLDMPAQGTVYSSPSSFTCNGVSYDSIFVNHSHVGYFLGDSQTIVYSPEDGWADDSYRYLIFDNPVNSSNAIFRWLNSNELNPVNPQVSAALNFSGQVLDFIVSTPFVLALLGLSIGLFLVVPFSIRKLKEFVKGY